jgi:photosystem II stability/assembly factor-like uncharacterized protein
MKADMGPRGTSADGIQMPGTTRLQEGCVHKRARRAKDLSRWSLAAGAACVTLLLLGLSARGLGLASDTDPASWAQTAGMSRTLEHLTEDAPTAPEGAKKAVGWAVGVESGGHSTILHTTDGGQIWERQGASEEVPNGNLTGVAAVNAREAWLVGNDGQESGLLLHTRDGGQRWHTEGAPEDLSGNGLVSVYAVDIYTAWAVGANGTILHTTDGGGHWVRQGVGQVPVVSLQGVYAADASHAWIVGENETGKEYGTILRTTDGGETWSKVPYSITHTPPPSGCYLITVHGASANEVWAVGRDQIIHVSVASTGIRATDQTPDFAGGFDINGVFAVNRKTVWAVADNSAIWRSVNGGKKWTKRAPQGAGYVFRVSAIDKHHAWVTTGDYSGRGQILYTDDGGKTWTPQPIPADPQMWGISFVR